MFRESSEWEEPESAWRSPGGGGVRRRQHSGGVRSPWRSPEEAALSWKDKGVITRCRREGEAT